MVLVLSITTVSLLGGVVYLTLNKFKLVNKLQDEKIKLSATTNYAESLALRVANLQRALDVCQATSTELTPKPANNPNKRNKNPKQA